MSRPLKQFDFVEKIELSHGPVGNHMSDGFVKKTTSLKFGWVQ